MDEKPEEHLAFQFAPLYASLQQAFEAIFERARSQRVIFVIDEFPYLAKADPSVSSILQALIDRASADSKLLLLLCGSSLSFMKEQVLGEKSPLYGRRTAQIELKPFDFFTAMELFPQRNPIETAEIYGMVGAAYPFILCNFRMVEHYASSPRRQRCSTRTQSSTKAPSILLMQEVSGASRYNAVIDAIANGRTQSGGDSNRNWLHHSGDLRTTSKSLSALAWSPRRAAPWAERARGRSTDSATISSVSGFDSSHRILPRSNVGCRERAWRSIEKALSGDMGPVFEDICNQWLWRQMARDESAIAIR